MIFAFSEIDFLLMGLGYAGHTQRSINRTKYDRNVEYFEAKYYVCPKTCQDLFRDLQSTNIEGPNIGKPKPQHLLMALYYLKVYPTEKNFGGYFHVSEKTAKKWAIIYVQRIQALESLKIKWLWDEEGLVQNQETFILSVDGIHCRICEPRTDPGAKWYSHKHNKAGFSYEIAIAIFHQQVCWVNGPFPCGTNDIGMYKKGLKHKIPAGKKLVADEGYTGESEVITTRNAFDSTEVKRFKGRTKARHETFNGRLKRFNILEDRFRTMGPTTPEGPTREEKHRAVFIACVVLVQYQIDHGRPLFEV